MFKVSPASLRLAADRQVQGDTRLTLTPCVICYLDTVIPTEEQFQYCFPLLLFAVPASGVQQILQIL
jgi:hypothetical protein